METTTLKIEDIKRINWVMENLRKLSKQLHRLDESACNYGLTARQEKRQDKLVKEANEWAGHLGMKCYHQGDPRGCSLYLVPLDFKSEDDQYTNGVAIY